MACYQKEAYSVAYIKSKHYQPCFLTWKVLKPIPCSKWVKSTHQSSSCTDSLLNKGLFWMEPCHVRKRFFALNQQQLAAWSLQYVSCWCWVCYYSPATAVHMHWALSIKLGMDEATGHNSEQAEEAKSTSTCAVDKLLGDCGLNCWCITR